MLVLFTLICIHWIAIYMYNVSGPGCSKPGQRNPLDKSQSGGETLTKQTMLSAG